MNTALDKDETFPNFNSPLEWASDQFKFVLNNELFTRNHVQSHKAVPETKIENQQTIKTFSQKFSKTQAVEETSSWLKYGNYYTTITACFNHCSINTN